MSSNSSSSSSSSRLNNSNHCQVILRNYISEGGFKYVSKGYYDEGQRKGQACVGKIYKTGSVYIDKPFEKELLTSEQSLTLIHAFNKAGFIDKIVRLNKPEIWRKDYPPHEKHLTEVKKKLISFIHFSLKNYSISFHFLFSMFCYPFSLVYSHLLKFLKDLIVIQVGIIKLKAGLKLCKL